MVPRISRGLPSYFTENIRFSRLKPPKIKSSSCRSISSSPCALNSKKLHRFDYQDAYAFHQAKQRKEANVARQAVLREQRTEALGDPIRGVPTAFLESLDAPKSQPAGKDIPKVINESDQSMSQQSIPSKVDLKKEKRLGHFVTQSELQNSLEYSRVLTEPVLSLDRAVADIAQEAADAQLHKARHQSALEVVNRILNLDNASSMQRTRANIQRIIDTFGRHVTDQYMKPKAPSRLALDPSVTQLKPTPRAGPDVGSSEVQIGILTAKIRVLANRYENEGRKDKVNKRNLRLLLHRRQKLLRYMLRKERGSPRWHHMIEKLGLTEATWQGEIEVP